MASDISFAMLTCYGGGRHVIFITDPYKLQVVSCNSLAAARCTLFPNYKANVSQWNQFSILSESLYGLSMAFLKLSVLAFYKSIFGSSRRFEICLWIMAVFVAAWGLTAFLGGVAQCIPIARAYDPSIDGYCINFGQLSLVITICNVITDLMIIVLPIPLVLRLQVSNHRRNVIILTFAAGSR